MSSRAVCSGACRDRSRVPSRPGQRCGRRSAPALIGACGAPQVGCCLLGLRSLRIHCCHLGIVVYTSSTRRPESLTPAVVARISVPIIRLLPWDPSRWRLVKRLVIIRTSSWPSVPCPRWGQSRRTVEIEAVFGNAGSGGCRAVVAVHPRSLAWPRLGSRCGRKSPVAVLIHPLAVGPAATSSSARLLPHGKDRFVQLPLAQIQKANRQRAGAKQDAHHDQEPPYGKDLDAGSSPIAGERDLSGRTTRWSGDLELPVL